MFFGGEDPFEHLRGRGGRGPQRSSEPVDTEGLYKILGVPKTATTAEIRSAFKKGAVKGDYRHPDRGGDEEKVGRCSLM